MFLNWIDKLLKKYFHRVFSTILLLELFLGGAGRLFEITPSLTLRMVLFAIALGIAILHVAVYGKINRTAAYVTGALVAVLGIAAMVGLANGAQASNILEDIKPLLSFFTVIYLSIAIRTIDDIKIVEKIIIVSSCILAGLHIAVFLMLQIDIYDLQALHTYVVIASSLSNNGDEVTSTSEFFFKGSYGLINYKGDIYMCIGFIFIQKAQFKKQSRKVFILLLTGFAIFLTGTRGFIVMLAAVYLLEWLVNNPRLRTMLLVLMLSIPSIMGYFWFKGFTGDKDDSDETRYKQIEQVAEAMNPVSLFTGHGLGIGVPVRPVHMEISYLEIYHKQGLLGLLFWAYIFWLIYKRAGKTGKKGEPFLLATTFVFLLSLTNPYVNHPLGITVIITSISCLGVLMRLQTRQEYGAKFEGTLTTEGILLLQNRQE